MACLLYLAFSRSRSRLIQENRQFAREVLKLKTSSGYSVNASRMLDTTPDVLDNFAERLVKNKLQKWNSVKAEKLKQYECNKSQLIESCAVAPDALHFSNTHDDEELDEIIRKVVQRDDIVAALQKCIQHKCCPSPAVLLELVSRFSRVGDTCGIEAIQTICKQGNIFEFENQAGYAHYIAEATWVKGGDFESSLEQFLDVYSNHIPLRRKVRSMLRNLTEEIVTRRGEAHLVIITNFGKRLALQYGDFNPLSFLWQFCFMSEWYSDQQFALELLVQHEELRTAIIERIPVVAIVSLEAHKVETLHRLLEVLLRFHMFHQYEKVLRAFFDYKCNRGDLQSCSAIIQSSLELQVTLTADQHQRFLSLLLNEQCKLGRTKQYLRQPPPVKPFQFKF